ncbi:MAG: 4-alpha-glucanotransferase [Planctomycetes bacterium]|nr:4-alpha-glucanotransferase [Planctomycetota bacterium]
MSTSIFDHRQAGVLLHLGSVPGPHGIGDLGPQAFRVADWIAASGSTLWQMLPVGPVGKGDSPYSATSSFAIEPLFLSLEELARKGLLSRESLKAPASLGRGKTDYTRARAFKWPRFLEAFERFTRKGGIRSASFQKFRRDHRNWLPGWCDFASRQDGREPALHAFVQFMLAEQWQRLRRHCSKRGVHLIGDLPIFVSLDSADVCDHPELFRLDAKGRPEVVTGVPPDCFSKDGQLWEHPHYRWPAHRRQRFAWWISRVRIALNRFDALRIDHFVGLNHAYEIPGAARTARKGEWRPTPGRELLTAIRKKLGVLPLIAEDLGALTPAAEKLRDDFGLPGMKLLHNAFYGPNSGDLPHRHPKRSVIYPGTHDNDTTRGWWQGLAPPARARFLALSGADSSRPEKAMIRMAYGSPANTAIVAAQDLLGLERRDRMNVPGVAVGNWSWRLEPGALRAPMAARLRKLALDSGRLAL